MYSGASAARCGYGIGFLASLFLSSAALAQSPVSPVAVTFMARGLEIGGPSKSVTGHAFMVIRVSTARGEISSAYGFYPSTGGLGRIKGPGMLKSEFRCSQAECLALAASAQNVNDSITVPITETERLKVMALVDSYNGPKLFGPSQPQPEYTLKTENCNAFVGEVAQALGYPTPSPRQFPTAYLASLRGLVQIEQARRAKEYAEQLRRDAEAEKRRAEAERRDAEEQRRLAEEELRRADEARRQADERRRREAENRVPAGWVMCNCPDKHRDYGRLFNGSRWHADDVAYCK